jgi:hypothetical protein
VEYNEEKMNPWTRSKKTAQSVYFNLRIKIDKGKSVHNKEMYVKQQVKQEYYLLPRIFNTFIQEHFVQ